MTLSTDPNDLSMFMLSHITAKGRLNADEYRQAWAIAMADGQLDERERRILNRLFELLPPADISEDMQSQIDSMRLRMAF